MAAGHKVVVLNSTSDPITLRLTTAAGTPIYNGSWTLKRGDRYELSNINEIILVTVESAKCGTLKADLARGADWNVDVKAAGNACELIKITKSKM